MLDNIFGQPRQVSFPTPQITLRYALFHDFNEYLGPHPCGEVYIVRK